MAEHCGGHRQFDQIGPFDRVEGEARCVAPAVMVVRNRRDARRIGIALPGKFLVRPRSARVDGEARRAVSGHLATTDVFQNAARPSQVFRKFGRREGKYALVIVSVAGEFMPGIDNRTDRLRHAFGHPAEREECRLHSSAFEQREDRFHIALDAQFAAIPVAALDGGLERADLKPVFHVDRQAVDDLRCGRMRLVGGREVHG